MIEIKDTVISEELISRQFVCHLEKCKGTCCVGGDAGAPIEKEEIELLDRQLDRIAPYMTPAYLEDVRKNGIAEDDGEGGYAIKCQPTGECNFVVYDKGIAGCAIEKAWKAGATDFRKPISCHLYPVRIKKYKEFSAVNYHEWSLCQPACMLGEELKVPVYRFLKDALIRKFGQDWYDELCAVADYMQEK